MAEELLMNELDAKSKTLNEYKEKIDDLRMENMDILSQLQTKERDSMEVIKYLRKENEELQEKLRKYKEEADEAREVAERTMRTAGEERDRAISEIETKFKTNDEVREAEVRKLREDLFSLKTFKDRKEVLEAELESVHQELFDAQTAHKEAMSGVERKLIEEKTRLQKEAHAQLMEIKRNTDEEVVNRLDVSTKRILQQNRRLAEDLKLHVQETADLQRIKATLEAENLKMKRDMSLNKEQVELYSKEKYKNSREVKDLQNKVKNLEKSLSQVVKDFEKERDRLQSKGRQEKEELEVENSGMRKLLKLKEREHVRIKKLAQDIIAQRTEVEQFFLESLEQVRDEIVRERKERESTFITNESSTHFGSRLPQIRGGSGGGDRNGGSRSSSRRQGQGVDRVDLKDLGWEDKERVLRLLFAKINQSGGQGGASTHSAQSTRMGHGGAMHESEEEMGESEYDYGEYPSLKEEEEEEEERSREEGRGGGGGGGGGGVLQGASSVARPVFA